VAITLAPEDRDAEVFDTTTGTVMFPVDQALENELNSIGVNFERKAEFVLALVERRAGTQVREQQHQAPRESVDRYTAQLAEGALFPPIVVQADPAAPEERFFLIDGNSRMAALANLKRKVFPAYIVHARDFVTCQEIGIYLNQRNGLSLEKQEALRWAKAALARGTAASRVARISGLSKTTVKRMQGENYFDERAGMVRLDEGLEKRLTQAAKAEIAERIKDDSVFKAIAELADDTGMTASTDLKTLIREVSNAPSEAERLRVIETERGRRAAQIEAHRREEAHPKPPYSTQMLKHLTFIRDRSPDELFELNPNARPEAERLIREVLAKLTAALELYASAPAA
jgi:ParB-like chromosome segregation protein Spo0J